MKRYGFILVLIAFVSTTLIGCSKPPSKEEVSEEFKQGHFKANEEIFRALVIETAPKVDNSPAIYLVQLEGSSEYIPLVVWEQYEDIKNGNIVFVYAYEVTISSELPPWVPIDPFGIYEKTITMHFISKNPYHVYQYGP